MTRQELIENIKRKRSFLCVGLDTDLRKIPEHLMRTENPMLTFNRAIIDATAGSCVAYKPNVAFYESMGAFEYKYWSIQWLTYASNTPINSSS